MLSYQWGGKKVECLKGLCNIWAKFLERESTVEKMTEMHLEIIEFVVKSEEILPKTCFTMVYHALVHFASQALYWRMPIHRSMWPDEQ